MLSTHRLTVAGAILFCAAAVLAAGPADVRTPEVSDARGLTQLHVAAQGTDADAVGRLLGAGAAVDARDAQMETPLHRAARFLRPEAMRLLIAGGADVNARNASGQTPLHVLGASARPDVDELDALRDELAAELIAAGADPRAEDRSGEIAWPREPAGGGGERTPSGYPSLDTIASTLLSRANTYPTLCQRLDLGVSYGNRHFYGLNISDNVGVQEDEPEVKLIANMHGDEVVGLMMCMNMIDYLLTNYGTDPRVTNIVNEMDIWIIPTMNPDGYYSNSRYNGGGSDLNRTFPEGAPPNPQPNTTAGHPPEVGVIMNFSFARSFTLAINFHGGALVINYPFDNYGSGSIYTPDDDLFRYISEQYSQHNLPMWNSTEFHHGITLGSAWYVITGGMQDWDYRYMGGNEVTAEIGTTKSPAFSSIPTYWNDNRESMLAYMETCLIGVRGIVTDAMTGAPLAATVTVLGRDHNIYTDPDVGDYHRMLLPGNYSLKFEAAGYESQTIPVTVNAGDATRLDVVLGGPPQLVSPNGGETLTEGVPTTVSWNGSPTQQFQVQLTTNYGATGQTTDGFEGGALGTAYTTGGSAGWYVASGTAHAGSYAARGGIIGNSQSTWMTRQVQGGDINFYYKVSSEPGYDYFNFYVDGVQKVHRAGNVNWTYYSETLAAGTHTLKWEYIKDAGTVGGSDTAWIDDLTVTGDATTWTDIIALTAPGAQSTPWTPSVAGSTNKVRVRAYFGSGNYSGWDTSDSLFTVVAPPTGACCAGDGSCSLATQSACTGGGGVYQGDATACDPNPCAPPVCPGDCNCDHAVGFADIDLFVAAIPNNQANWSAKYQAYYGAAPPAGCWANCDVNGNGNVGFDDIDLFVGLIPSACPN